MFLINGNARGLLCVNCNMGIGSLQHDKAILLKAIEYLKPCSYQH